MLKGLDQPPEAPLRHPLRRAEELVELLDPHEIEAVAPVVERFRMQVGPYYLSLIDPEDPADPIRKMALPDVRELDVVTGERRDPIGDDAHRATPILVHRYPDRALLFPTWQCPMFCRYCFRKVALNEAPIALWRELPATLEYLAEHPSIREVILSGGDPLSLSDAVLDRLLGALSGVGTLRRLRIHSRYPVTEPTRVTRALAATLAKHRPLYVVTHFNHPRELTDEARAAVCHLSEAGITVLNQAVLLAGVNDSAEVLAELFEGLLDWQVRPYYLHHPDMVVGAAHFRVSLDRGLELTRGLRGRLSGLALPTYVLDIPGGRGKVAVDSAAVERLAEGRWRLHSPLGGSTEYRG